MFGQNDSKPVSLAHAWAGGGGRVGVGAGRKKTDHDFNQWESWNQELLLKERRLTKL